MPENDLKDNQMTQEEFDKLQAKYSEMVKVKQKEIADALRDFYGIPVVSGLIKHRHTEAQSTLSREERLHSVKGAFSVKDDGAIEGKSVLLVDDIVTTGATLCACADALYDAGALEVRALAFSHSDFADGDKTV